MTSKAPGLLTRILNPLIQWRRRNLGAALSKYGLRVDDMLDPDYNKDVAEALKLLPERERVLRQRRLVRALDLSCKHEKLPEELQKIQDPWNRYLWPLVMEVRKRRIEKSNYH